MATPKILPAGRRSCEAPTIMDTTLYNQSVQERLWAKVQKSDGCWTWQGAHMTEGYGVLRVAGKNVRAHRISYELVNGPVEDGLMILHSCDNPACVNPAHLSKGTALDNVRDMIQKGRVVSAGARKTHCPRGHEYNQENTSVRQGHRHCKTCDRLKRKGRQNTPLLTQAAA